MSPYRALLFFLVALAAPLAAERWVIAAERYEIEGRSRPEAIQARIGNPVGQAFDSRESLDAFVADRARRLTNLRVFKKSAVRTEEGSPAEGSADIPITLVVTIEDSSSLALVPYAFYNSNEGFMAGVLANAPNLAGSLQRLTVTGLYAAPPNEDDTLRWTDPNYVLVVAWGGPRLGPITVGSSASLSRMRVRVRERGIEGLRYEATTVSGSLTVKADVADSLAYTATARASYTPSHEILWVEDQDLLAQGPLISSLAIENSIQLDRVDWVGNFREGFLASLSATASRIDPVEAGPRVEISGKGELIVFPVATRRLNPSVRLVAFGKTGEPNLQAASAVRGVRNAELMANLSVAANLSLQIFVARVRSAEIHLIPAIDGIWAYTREAPDYRHDWGVGAGADLVVVFDAMRSLPVKLGFAMDLRPHDRLGEGKRYEIDFGFRFTY